MDNGTGNRFWKKAGMRVSAPAIGTLVMIGFLAALFGVLAPRYLSDNNVIDIFRTVSVRFVVSLAMGVVIASGGFDLSIGHVAGFSGLITAYMLVNLRLSIPVSVVSGIMVGTLLGCVNGLIVGWLGVSSFITTLGMQMVIVGLRYWLTNGTTIMNLPKAFCWYGGGKVNIIPAVVAFAFAILLIMPFVIHRTTLGRRDNLKGQNLEASGPVGASPRKNITLLLILYSALGGLAGLLIWYGVGKVYDIPVIVVIAFVILLIMLFVMHRTTLGRRIISVGQNLEASRLSGINPRIYTALALILSGALSGVAGVLIVARNGLANVDVGDKYLLEAMTIAVLAHVMFGKFKAHGVMLMTLFIIMLTNGLTMLGVDPSFMDMIRGTMLIVVIVFGKFMQFLRNRRRVRPAEQIE